MSCRDKKYFFDANAFIEIQRVYPKESFQDLHEIIDQLIKNGTIIVHHMVYKEVLAGTKDDEVKKLLEKHTKKVLPEVQEEYDEIHENNKKLLTRDIVDPQRPWREREQADPYLVARILVERHKVSKGLLKEVLKEEYYLVTMDKKLSKKCKEFSIPCLRVLEFFKDTGVKFTAERGI